MREEQWEISESYLDKFRTLLRIACLRGCWYSLCVCHRLSLSLSISLFFVDSVNCTFLHSTLMTTKNGSNLWLKKKMQTVHSAGKDSTNQHVEKQFSSLTLIFLSLALILSWTFFGAMPNGKLLFLYKKFPFIAERLSMY